MLFCTNSECVTNTKKKFKRMQNNKDLQPLVPFRTDNEVTCQTAGHSIIYVSVIHLNCKS